MRIATLIISLCLTVVLGLQSLAVMAAGSLSSSLSENATEKQQGDEIGAGGAIGVFVSLLWLIAAAFVIAKPKVSMWVFGVASVFCLIGGTSGFSDLFIWAGASALFALASWRGIREQAVKDERERAAYKADIAAAAAQIAKS
jgi:hypothetical protein